MGLEAMRAASSDGALGSGDSWVTDLLSQAQTAKRGQSWSPGPALPPLASLHSHLIEPWEWFGNSCLAPVQFSSVTQLCPTLCDPMDCSMPGSPIHHQLLKFTQIHVH